jgi:hypothetical protein
MARNKRKGAGGMMLKLGMAGLLVVVVLVVALVAGIGIWIKGYLRGDTFRELASIKTADAFRSEGKYEEISWTGSSSVYSDGFSATGLPESTFTKIDAEGVRAQTNVGELLGFWNLLRFWDLSEQALEISEINVNRLTLQAETKRGRPLAVPATPVLPDAGPEPPLPVNGHGNGHGNGEGIVAPVAVETDLGKAIVAGETGAELLIEEEKGFFESLAPQEVRLELVNIVETNVFVAENGERKVALTGLQTRMRPMEGTEYEGWRVTGKGGKILIEGVPELELDSINTNFRGSDVFITDASANLFETGMITGSGELHFGGENAAMDLRLKFGDIDVSHLMSEEWKTRVQGNLAGDVHVTGKPGDAATHQKTGTLTVSKGVLENLPVLEQIANYANAERFRRLVLTKASADFEATSEGTLFRNIDVESDGLTRITGTVLLAGKAIKGEIKLGVTPGTLQWIPGAEQKVFVEPADGYLWTTVKVSGTLDDIEQDLSSRLVAAAAEAIVGVPVEGAENAKDVMQGVGKKLTEEISKQTGQDSKQIEETAEKLWDDLRKSFFGK